MNLKTTALCCLNLDETTAKTVLGLIDENINPFDFQSVRDWVAQCYNTPSTCELIMCALNEVLGGFGVEAITDERFPFDSYWGNIGATYVNMGDSYIPTILRDRQDNFIVCSWGDWYEEAERNNFNI